MDKQLSVDIEFLGRVPDKEGGSSGSDSCMDSSDYVRAYNHLLGVQAFRIAVAASGGPRDSSEAQTPLFRFAKRCSIPAQVQEKTIALMNESFSGERKRKRKSALELEIVEKMDVMLKEAIVVAQCFRQQLNPPPRRSERLKKQKTS